MEENCEEQVKCTINIDNKDIDTSNNTKITNDKNQVDQKPKKKKRPRCFHCGKGKGQVLLPCKCGNVYCSHHRMYESHNCQYDYKGESLKKLKDDLMSGHLKKTINSF